MKEGRLLRFMKIFHKPFHLVNDGGMPVAVPPEQTFAGAKTLSDQDYTGGGGLVEAITAVLGEGGIMFGWQVFTIGPIHLNEVNVIVVREKNTEANGGGARAKSQATSQYYAGV
ncbi:MAG: hypothetical protein Q9226_003911 [Calogaya cf. arnoldii]